MGGGCGTIAVGVSCVAQACGGLRADSRACFAAVRYAWSRVAYFFGGNEPQRWERYRGRYRLLVSAKRQLPNSLWRLACIVSVVITSVMVENVMAVEDVKNAIDAKSTSEKTLSSQHESDFSVCNGGDVARTDFVGMTAFSKDALQNLDPRLGPQPGQPIRITDAEFEDLEDLITRHYVNAGYVNSRAAGVHCQDKVVTVPIRFIAKMMGRC